MNDSIKQLLRLFYDFLKIFFERKIFKKRINLMQKNIKDSYKLN
jgi:hypothetical protein